MENHSPSISSLTLCNWLNDRHGVLPYQWSPVAMNEFTLGMAGGQSGVLDENRPLAREIN